MIITKRIFIHRIIEGTWLNSLIILFTCVFAYLLNEYLLQDVFELPAVVSSVLGTALAFFIGFNNNQAYDRWWEARKIWGALVNDSRSWARQVTQYTTPNDGTSDVDMEKIRSRMVKRHIAFLYALKEYLRDTPISAHRNFLSAEESDSIELESNRHNAILTRQSKDLESLYRSGSIDGFRFRELNQMLINFTDEMGKSERIKNTVFPPTYNYYTRAFTWIFIVCVTILLSNLIGLWGVLFGGLLGYVFITIHAIGMVLIDPFDNKPTGVSIDAITRTIEINLLEMLGEKEIPMPIESVKGEYIM